ncbi:Glycine cleavage system H protein 2, mitochondrial [Vitis vinifera]|uniref:Glycine cleavage system H protein 2, mitochondrial n=1 Tax=Vitis vinifera TaxID=29760 RepID=A0A438ECM3_VITVI|nr:Glycine cleavage system H protein 2, mitochondrial [Vitis vinifera]
MPINKGKLVPVVAMLKFKSLARVLCVLPIVPIWWKNLRTNNAGCIANLAPSSNSLRWESWLSSPISAAGSVATHTGTIGIIHPPPDIRNIVDKTARFVAKNGPEFEKRIMAKFIVKDLKYADSHEWVKIDGNSAIGSSFGAVESVKATSDINSPVSGKVVEVNEELNSSPGLLSPQMLDNLLVLTGHSWRKVFSSLFIFDTPFLIQVNASPYENGWIIKVEMSDTGELNSLMDLEQYTKFCEEEDAKH